VGGLKAKELRVCTESMKAEIDVTTVPRIVLISGGRVKQLDMPHHGEVVVKTAQGRITKFEVKEGELF
jgi:hypothetical protein